jgi:metal-sulfur cluster biosynthetic enzyme
MSLPTSEEVRDVLRARVRDPELGMNIVDLGLIYGVDITDNKTVEITMTLTSPGCPAGPEIITNTQREVHQAYPAIEEVNVHLTWTPFWNPDMMSEEAKEELGIYHWRASTRFAPVQAGWQSAASRPGRVGHVPAPRPGRRSLAIWRSRAATRQRFRRWVSLVWGEQGAAWSAPQRHFASSSFPSPGGRRAHRPVRAN